MIGYIYKTTNLINGKIYIGKHLATKFSLSYKGSGAILKQAFKKYGKENFSCELIAEATTEEELNNLEAYWVKMLDSRNPEIGYNIVEGGLGTSGYHHSEEAKQKMSEAKSGILLTEEWKSKIAEANKRRTHSPETKQKISNSNKGKKRSEEAKANMRKGHQEHPTVFTDEYRTKLKQSRAEAMNSGRWSISEEGLERLRESGRRQKSEEHRKHISDTRKTKQLSVGANNPNAKKIYCIETNTIYNFAKEAAEALNISVASVRLCCQGRVKSVKGFHLNYIDKETKNND